MTTLPDGTTVSLQVSETWEEVINNVSLQVSETWEGLNKVVGPASLSSVDEVKPGESFSATLSVTDKSGSALSGFAAKIDLLRDGAVVQTQDVQTGSDGDATAAFTAPDVSKAVTVTVRTQLDVLSRQIKEGWES